MILSTNTTVALQCVQCGELEFNAFSLFSFVRQNRKNLLCGCGSQLMSISTGNRRQFNLTYACAYCGETHYIKMTRRTLLGKEVLPLVCPNMEVPVGYIGSKQKVAQACQEREKSLEELALEVGYEEDFENSEVMLKILDYLHHLAKCGTLGCACGNNQLSFELLPDRIELYCEACEAVGVIYGDCADNIRQMEDRNSLYLEENKTWHINKPLQGQHLSKANEEENKWH